MVIIGHDAHSDAALMSLQDRLNNRLAIHFKSGDIELVLRLLNRLDQRHFDAAFVAFTSGAGIWLVEKEPPAIADESPSEVEPGFAVVKWRTCWRDIGRGGGNRRSPMLSSMQYQSEQHDQREEAEEQRPYPAFRFAPKTAIAFQDEGSK